MEILQGDCRKFAPALENTADRIVMGYIFDTEKFLPYALKIAKKGCTVHLHRNVEDDKVNEMKNKLQKDFDVSVKEIVKVKSYAPNISHYVFDLIKP